MNQIRQRAGLSALGSVDMNVIKKEKSYELWLGGSRKGRISYKLTT